MKTLTLIIKELTFSAAHYLPGHPKCGVIHGHTYFVRNLEVTYDPEKTPGEFVDLGDIKSVIKGYDHTLIIPQDHFGMWNSLKALVERKMLRMRYLPGNLAPTVENIGQHIKWELKAITGVTDVSFELYEGPNQGVEVC